MLESKSTFLQVDLLLSATKEQEFKVLSLGSGWNTSLPASPTWAFLCKAGGQISMTMEVSELLSQMALDTSGQALRSSTPKRPVSLALASSLPLKLDNFAKLVDTSSQVNIPDDVKEDDPTLEEIHTSPSHPDGTPEGRSDAPPLDAAQLQEEVNKALGCLLVMESTIDLHRRKEISDFGMALQHNESKVTKARKTEKGLCAHTIREAEACHMALIGEAKIHHVACIKEAEADCARALAEAENHCFTAIREAESQGALQAHLIQQSHAKNMQHLEAEAINEERMDCLTFLATCCSALRASPPKAHGILVTPFHLLLGNAPMSALLSIPPGLSPFQLEPAPWTTPASTTKAPKPLPQPNW